MFQLAVNNFSRHIRQKRKLILRSYVKGPSFFHMDEYDYDWTMISSSIIRIRSLRLYFEIAWIVLLSVCTTINLMFWRCTDNVIRLCIYCTYTCGINHFQSITKQNTLRIDTRAIYCPHSTNIYISIAKENTLDISKWSITTWQTM